MTGGNKTVLTSILAIGILSGDALAEEFEFPTRKPGMWEIQSVSDQPGPANMTIKACIDAASDRQLMAMGLNMSKSMCPEQTTAMDGDAFVVDATCNFGGMTTTSHTVMTGDFQSSYRVVSTSQMSGMPNIPGMPSGATTITQNASWVGAECTDGLVPGDMLMPGGMKVNINNMGKMFGG